MSPSSFRGFTAAAPLNRRHRRVPAVLQITTIPLSASGIEQTAKHTKRLADAAQSGGLTFT